MPFVTSEGAGEDLFSSEFRPVLNFILSQGTKLVSGKRACFFFKSSKRFIQIGNLHSSELGKKFAKISISKKRDIIVKKGGKGTQLFREESYLVGYLGEENQVALGAMVIEGIEHFDHFSEEDVRLIHYYCNNLTRILRDTQIAENSFTTGINNPILMLVDNANIHIKNNRLHYFLEEIIHVSILINSSLDISTLMEMIMESAKAVFRTEASSLLLLDERKEYLIFHTVTGEKKEEVAKIKVPMGQGIAGTVAVTKQPMIINDAQTDPRVFRDVDKASQFITRNILAAPLNIGDEVIGVIEAINTIDRNNFSQNDIDFFLSFSSACAFAIQKTGLLDNLNKTNTELKQKLNTLESLYEFGQAVLESPEEEGLLSKSLAIITKELEARATGLAFFHPERKVQVEVYFYENKELQKISGSITDFSYLYGLVEGKDGQISILESDLLRGHRVVLPLSRAASPACIFVLRDFEDRKFEEQEYRLLQTISSSLLKAYENLRLSKEMLAKKTLEKEIEITKNIQNNILPNELVKSKDFELGVKTVAAKEVSGDFYDFHSYGNENYSFLVADVSGKSLPAAIFMAMSSSIIRTLSRTTNLSPQDLLTQANQLIYEDSQSGMFVTLFYLQFDTLKSKIKFASAGHNDQIWIKSDGTYELLKGKGAPLGVIPKGFYSGGEISIKPEELLVLYTDGAIEEKNDHNEEFGLERFIEEISKRKNKSPSQIVEEVYQVIREFSNFQEQFDDFTVMILKFPSVMDHSISKKFEAHKSQIPALRDYLSEVMEGRVLDETVKGDVLVCSDEAASNILMHGYANSDHPHPYFECFISFTSNSIVIHLIDEAPVFERAKVPAPSLEANLKGERKGGFGVFLMEKLMDSVRFFHEDGKNHTVLEKRYI